MMIGAARFLSSSIAMFVISMVCVSGSTDAAFGAVASVNAVVVAAPTDLAAAAGGDSALDVVLTWKDSATQQQGYVIERSTDQSTWSELARTDAATESFTQVRAPMNVLHYYQVRAYAGQTVSPPSNMAALTIVGIPWIRIGRPLTGELFQPGAVCPIVWTSNRVSEARLYYSTDLGLTWTEITAAGAIEISDPHWGNYAWRVPPIQSDSVLVKVTDYIGKTIGYSGYFLVNPSYSAHGPRTVLRAGPVKFEQPSAQAFVIVITAKDEHVVQITDPRGRVVALYRGSNCRIYDMDTRRPGAGFFVAKVTVSGRSFTRQFAISR